MPPSLISHSFRAYLANYHAIKSAAAQSDRPAGWHSGVRPSFAAALVSRRAAHLFGAANKINLSAPYTKAFAIFQWPESTATNGRAVLMSLFNGSSFAFRRKSDTQRHGRAMRPLPLLIKPNRKIATRRVCNLVEDEPYLR
jgi:hypothetical protein